MRPAIKITLTAAELERLLRGETVTAVPLPGVVSVELSLAEPGWAAIWTAAQRALDNIVLEPHRD